MAPCLTNSLQIVCQDGGDKESYRKDGCDDRHDLIGAALLRPGEEIHFVTAHDRAGCSLGFTRLEQDDADH